MPLRRISTRSFGETFPTPQDDTQRSWFSRPKTLELDRGPPKPCGIPDRICADVENAPSAKGPKDEFRHAANHGARREGPREAAAAGTGLNRPAAASNRSSVEANAGRQGRMDPVIRCASTAKAGAAGMIGRKVRATLSLADCTLKGQATLVYPS